ncbi:hypothetical protein DICPUDRAFT_99935 [Dictyostelium purpureum]|uniref:Uncharacterized protein n=1 Tax=Dictyostelium purpureum TaxID=5786 RepID=F1A3W9_DICPU|nr:uncharacterized protein DICPUDRAFT_99935 [Dictyostelium purpureum]EGC29107.1 hypothetical protein DICPUDRAFT_99935 [Dictyostelium purpureum]|eukprot:XP_003294362.1 hypothetical protein DICPUDRAFT_99935 [Dictyostelium purpureum]
METNNFQTIIKFLLNHIYISSPYKRFSSRANHNNNEAISLSLVSKEFFQITSRVLTNEIIGFKNYDILKSLIDHNGKKPFKLIHNTIEYDPLGNKPFILIKKYHSFQQYQKDISEGVTFERALVCSLGHSDSMKVLKKISIFPNNHLFDLTITEDSHDCVREIKEFLQIDIPESLNRVNKVLVEGNFKSDIKTNKIHHDLLKAIVKLNAKRVWYNSRDSKGTHYLYNSLFLDNTATESIIFEIGDHQEPFSLNAIRHLPNLKKLSTYVAFHDIIRLANNVYSKKTSCKIFNGVPHGSFDSESVVDTFNNNMVLFNQHPKLNHFSFKSFCTSDSCLSQTDKSLDFSVISKAFSILLNSSNSKAKSLDLQGFNFINSDFLQSVASNKTIRDLSLIGTNPEPFFLNVFPTNKTIRNLYLQNHSTEFFKLIGKYRDNFNLYSITVFTMDSKSIPDYIKLLKLNSLQLKELKVIIFNGSKRDMFQRVINNVLLTVS